MTDKLQEFFAAERSKIRRRYRLKHIYGIYHKLLGRDTLREVTRHGIRFNLRCTGLEEWLLKSLKKNQYWEWNLAQYLLTQAHNRGCDVFLDIGANIGYYSLLAAKLQIAKEIHAVEPIKETFQRLVWHIEANDFTDSVTAHNFAISDHEGTVQMLSMKSESFIIQGDNAKEGEQESVATTTLDSLFDFRGRKLVIKMDVEGHELAALHGAERLLAQNDIFLQVEIFNRNTSTIEYLLSQGFKLVHFHGHLSHYADFHFERKATQP